VINFKLGIRKLFFGGHDVFGICGASERLLKSVGVNSKCAA